MGNGGKPREIAGAGLKGPIGSESEAWWPGLTENRQFCAGGEGWIRTSVRLRGQIYSLLPLTTRPPLHRGQAGAPHGGAPLLCQRVRWRISRRPFAELRALQQYQSPRLGRLERVK